MLHKLAPFNKENSEWKKKQQRKQGTKSKIKNRIPSKRVHTVLLCVCMCVCIFFASFFNFAMLFSLSYFWTCCSLYFIKLRLNEHPFQLHLLSISCSCTRSLFVYLSILCMPSLSLIFGSVFSMWFFFLPEKKHIDINSSKCLYTDIIQKAISSTFCICLSLVESNRTSTKMREKCVTCKMCVRVVYSGAAFFSCFLCDNNDEWLYVCGSINTTLSNHEKVVTHLYIYFLLSVAVIVVVIVLKIKTLVDFKIHRIDD